MQGMATSSADFPDALPAAAPAPAFSLLDVRTGSERSFHDLAGPQGTLIVFLCAHCPYVLHVLPKLIELSNEFFPQGISTIGISANDPIAYPEDAPDKLRAMAEENDLPFPLLFDGSQEIARAYTAACTPDFFLFNREKQLVYRGQLDDSRPGNGIPVTGEDLRAALDAVLSGKPVAAEQKPSIGCNIKWKS